MEEFMFMQERIRATYKDSLDEIAHLKKLLNDCKIENERLVVENNGHKKDKSELLLIIRQRSCSNCVQLNDNIEKPTTVRDIGINDGQLYSPLSSEKVRHINPVEALPNTVLNDEDLSSMFIESQFVSDNSVKNAKEGLARSTTAPNQTTIRVLEEIFGPSQPVRSKNISNILAPESPENFNSKAARSMQSIPETEAQAINETTPMKSRPSNQEISPVFDSGWNAVVSSKDERNVSKSVYVSPLRVVPVGKLINEQTRRDIHQLISPPHRNPSEPSSAVTPKRKRLGSPWKMRSPRQTMPKSVAPLKKSHLIKTEISTIGVRKLTQTQLNVACFKKPSSLDMNDSVLTLSVPATPSPVKTIDDDHDIAGIPMNDNDASINRPFTPLQSIENSPDLNETALSISAIRRVARDVVRNVMVKEEMDNTYDRVPDQSIEENVRNKEYRKTLPGQDCPECNEFYRVFGDADGRLLDKCSRHRTRKTEVPSTPRGFWKPTITQSEMPLLDEESLKF